MRKWRFPSGKQTSQRFNSSLKGRGAAENETQSQLTQLQLPGEEQGFYLMSPGLGMEAKAPGITFSFLPERERRIVKGTLELSLQSSSKYLLSLSALVQGPMKDAQK